MRRFVFLTLTSLLLAACTSIPTSNLKTAMPTVTTVTPDAHSTGTSESTAASISSSTPTSTTGPTVSATPEIVATSTAKDGQSITVAVVAVGSTHKIQVTRGNSVFWLKSSNSSNKYGCEVETPSYDTFGCYFPLEIWIIDLDGDGEPEVASWWEQDGSGGYKSLHVHRWDGDMYQLIGEFAEMQLSVELQDLDDDNQQKVVLRYNVGPHQLPIPWIDVCALSGRQLVSINKEYPGFYEALLIQYEEMLPDYQAVADGWPEALVELEQRIEMAKNITGDD